MAANSVRCPRDRGESVKGGLPPPFHKKVTTNRNSPKRAEGARGSFDSRREAPGGCRTGSDPNQNEGPEATSGQDPVRGPLDGFEDPEPAVRFRRGIARQGVVLSEWESTKYGPPLRGPRESALRGFARLPAGDAGRRSAFPYLGPVRVDSATRFRPPAAGCADQRSAFPGLRNLHADRRYAVSRPCRAAVPV